MWCIFSLLFSLSLAHLYKCHIWGRKFVWPARAGATRRATQRNPPLRSVRRVPQIPPSAAPARHQRDLQALARQQEKGVRVEGGEGGGGGGGSRGDGQ